MDTKHLKKQDSTVYIIADPVHSMGFMVMAYTEPVGFIEPEQALHVLQKARQERGNHIGLFQVEAVTEAVTKQSKMVEYLKGKGLQDLDISFVSEFIKKDI